METETKTVEAAAPVAEPKEVTNTPAPIVEQETPEQINWKKFREAREIERKQKVEAEKRAYEKEQEASALKAAMEAILNKPTFQNNNPSNQENNTDNAELSESERIQKIVHQALADKDRRDNESRAQREQIELPKRLNDNFSDFNEVCSASNIDYLEYHYPDVASAFKHMPDGYEKWAAIYRSVKRFVPNTNSDKQASKADKNLGKPQAMSIAGKTQVGDTAPQMLDDKRKADNWSRMQRRMKGGS